MKALDILKLMNVIRTSMYLLEPCLPLSFSYYNIANSML